jgi:hypothetical protein
MTERWKAWKTKSRFSTLPSAPWKSRKGGEIPTFPQVLLPSPSLPTKPGKAEEQRAMEKWKSKEAGFPLSHSPESCLRRKEEDHLKTTERSSSPVIANYPFHAHLALEPKSISCSSLDWKMLD